MAARSILALTCSALCLFSCAPKDQKLVRPDGGGQFKAESITSDSSVKLVTSAFDRTAEAISLLKVLFDPAYAAGKNLTIESISETENQQLVKINATDATFENNSFVQTSEVNLLATITRNSSREIVSIMIRDNFGGQAKTQLFTKVDGKKSALPSVLLVSKSKYYLIKKSDPLNVFTIEVNAVDSVKSFKRKKLNEVYSDSLSEVSSKASIEWDGRAESLNQKIKITSVAPEYQPQLSQVKTQLISEGPVDLFINLNECSGLEGHITLSSVKTKTDTVIEKQDLVFSSSGVQVSGKTTTYKWADCPTRPLVDLTQSL